MTRDKAFIYSPLSEESANTERARGLLLQFILRELIQAEEGALLYVSGSAFFPNDWGQEAGCLNRLKEHVQLLASAFPQFPEESGAVEKLAEEQIPQWDAASAKKIFTALHPFLTACKDNENLLFFLLQHQRTLAALGSKKTIKELLKDKGDFLVQAFTARGFTVRAKESKALFKALYE